MQLRTVRQQVARMREKIAVRSAKLKELQNSNADRGGFKFLFPSVEANNVTDALLNTSSPHISSVIELSYFSREAEARAL